MFPQYATICIVTGPLGGTRDPGRPDERITRVLLHPTRYNGTHTFRRVPACQARARPGDLYRSGSFLVSGGDPMSTPDKPPREPAWITCRCGARWTALGAAHCGACHETFAGPTLFDQHRTQAGDHGTCRRPAELTTTKTGARVMYHRGGMWRGPELTDDEKAERFGNRAGDR